MKTWSHLVDHPNYEIKNYIETLNSQKKKKKKKSFNVNCLQIWEYKSTGAL